MTIPQQPQTRGRQLGRFAFILLYAGVLGYVIIEFFSLRGGLGVVLHGTGEEVTQRIFPLFGLLAFTLVWAQIIVGACMPVVRRFFPSIFRYHRLEGIFALLFAFTHPVLLAIGFGWSMLWHLGFVSSELNWLALFGFAGIFFLLLTVATALLSRRPWFIRHWRAIHYLNYITFAIIWVHSWRLGSDVYHAPLRWLWFVFGVTAVAAFSWRRWQRVVARRAARLTLPVQPQP